MDKSWIAKYPGDKDGMARFCVNVQVKLEQNFLLQLLRMAVVGFEISGGVDGPKEGADGPIYWVAREDPAFPPRILSVQIVASGLQAIFNPNAKVNHNLRMRFLAAIYADWGSKFLDAAACVALVKLGWGEKP